jgi:hypothetical protein
MAHSTSNVSAWSSLRSRRRRTEGRLVVKLGIVTIALILNNVRMFVMFVMFLQDSEKFDSLASRQSAIGATCEGNDAVKPTLFQCQPFHA